MKICKQCQKNFTTKNKNKIFCCEKCKINWWAKNKKRDAAQIEKDKIRCKKYRENNKELAEKKKLAYNKVANLCRENAQKRQVYIRGGFIPVGVLG